MNISDRLERMRQGAEDQRKAVFTRVQQAAPELLAAMQADQKGFGPFAASKIEINGEVIYERGELLPKKYDKYMRGRN